MLRFSQRFDLSSMWPIGTVTQLPLIARQTAASDSSAPVSEFGIGNVFVEPTLVRKLDPQWSIVFGARFFVPTASDSLGTGKWQVMPIMAARYEWADNSFFAPLARYAVSVAGDPSRRDISIAGVAASIEHRSAEELVRRALSKPRYSAQLWGPDFRTDWAIVPAGGCSCWNQVEPKLCCGP